MNNQRKHKRKVCSFPSCGSYPSSLYLAPPQPDPAPATAWDPAIPLRPGSSYQKKSKVSLNPHSLRATSTRLGHRAWKPAKAKEQNRRNGVLDSRRGEPLGFKVSQDPLSRVERCLLVAGCSKGHQGSSQRKTARGEAD